MNQEEKEQPQEEKKNGKMKQFFQGVKKKWDDSTFDFRLTNSYQNAHDKYVIHTGSTLFNSSSIICYGERCGEDEYAVWGEFNIPQSGLWEDVQTKEVYHILSISKTVLKWSIDGKPYVRPGQLIRLGKKAEKVEVIKIKDQFYKK